MKSEKVSPEKDGKKVVKKAKAEKDVKKKTTTNTTTEKPLNVNKSKQRKSILRVHNELDEKIVDDIKEANSKGRL